MASFGDKWPESFWPNLAKGIDVPKLEELLKDAAHRVALGGSAGMPECRTTSFHKASGH